MPWDRNAKTHVLSLFCGCLWLSGHLVCPRNLDSGDLDSGEVSSALGVGGVVCFGRVCMVFGTSSVVVVRLVLYQLAGDPVLVNYKPWLPAWGPRTGGIVVACTGST